MKIAYFDCSSGISGDMCLGALIHAGADFPELVSRLSLLPVSGYRIFAGPSLKNGIKTTGVFVDPGESHPHRHLNEILTIISSSSLSLDIKEKSSAIFTRLAEAEGEVHGLPADKVHFHEVGGIDAIIDIVGSVICLSLLEVDQVISSPLPMGHGFVECAHGRIPLPAPAAQLLLKGVPVYGIDIEGELVTPTGAGIISTLAAKFGPCPAMIPNAVGFGAGTKDFAIPNILRVTIGECASASQNERVTVIEATIDDMNPEIFTHLWDQIFFAGAVEMFYTPVQMKKGRPGILLTVLCLTPDREKVLAVIFRETSTLGVRFHEEERFCCPREIVQVQTKFGEVKVKIGSFDKAVNIAPEFEDCRAIAVKHHVSLKEIYQEALIAAKGLINKGEENGN